jgi:dTDP-4-amino-4,6-dideoxygalactose transaminase
MGSELRWKDTPRGPPASSAPVLLAEVPSAALASSPVRAAPNPRSEFLLFSPPCLGEEETVEVVAALRSGWLSTGPRTKQFEAEFMARLGSPGALALNSCTAGLHTALITLGIRPGDEVITTPLTFASPVNVIEHVGARPVLADVEPDTLTLSAAAVEAAITARTRAVLVVHYAGHPADLDAIQAAIGGRDIAIVEDAAHALSARYKGRLVGSGSNLTSFSFYATKNITTAEGGMLTGDPVLLERARVLSLHGLSGDAWQRYGRGGSWYYEVQEPGFKYNMSDLQAALGLAQLRKLDGFQARRMEVVFEYTRAFQDEPALEVPVTRPEVEHAWQLYVLRLRPTALRIGRDRFIQELTARNIGTSVHFIPIHLHPYYRNKYGYEPSDYPVTYESYGRMLSLPLHPGLNDHDVADVIDAVLDIAREFRR